MNTRKIAIACQGGGTHGAFTCGVLTQILQTKVDEEEGQSSKNAKRRFEICGLSGTSAGALNAFMVWYGMMPKDGKVGGHAEARDAVNALWDTFQVNKSGEHALNEFAQTMFRFQQYGFSAKHPTPAKFYDWLMTSLDQWSTMENLLAPKVDFGEIRPEFYDFDSLLRTCAPKFPTIDMDEVARQKIGPRLLVGAVEVLSGMFETFDSYMLKTQDLRNRTEEQAKRTISYEAVQASGTLPEIRRSQSIPGLKNIDGKDPLYWDGLFSQNPPVGEFLAEVGDHDLIPDDIWVIRINPQRRDSEPESLGDIEDRRNELAGNLSLNQELRFIKRVNDWIFKHPDFAKQKTPVGIYTIFMSKEWTDKLYAATKLDRDPAFVTSLREHGKERASEFLERWLTATDKELKTLQWPEAVFDQQL